MAKGMFTQGVAILFGRGVDIAEIRDLVGDFEVVKDTPNNPADAMWGPSFLLSYQPEINGYVSVDVQRSTWPDHMGDPAGEPELFAAWSMGFFGPFSYPGALERAASQAHQFEHAEEVVRRHECFVRLRTSYAFGAGDDDAIVPKGCSPVEELDFLNDLTLALLEHEAALGVFNPNGEVLLDKEILAESMAYHAEHSLPPLDSWSNIRLFTVDEEWALMDSVGCWQLDIPDHEVAFPKADIEPGEVDVFIRNAILYLLENGDVIKDGDTMDGPGGIAFQGMHFEAPVSDPPRTVLRWLPTGYEDIPEALLE